MIVMFLLALAATDLVPGTDQAQPAKLLPGFSVNLPDYPLADYRRGHQGRVRFELDIDATGKPTKCVVIEPTPFYQLNNRACKITLDRMRFSPALDAGGNPVASTGTQAIVWKIRRGG